MLFKSILATALVAFCTPSLAYPTNNCDWLGCALQTPLIETSHHEKQISTATEIKPSDIVADLKVLTAKAQAIQAPAQSISLVNGPLLVVGLGPFPKIITAYVDIVTTATTHLQNMQGMAPIKDSKDADGVFEAYRDFARINEFTFNLLIGKAALFSTVPLIGDPMRAVLRQVEAVYDSYTFMLIDGLPSRSADLQGVAGGLDAVEDRVIEAYSYTNV